MFMEACKRIMKEVKKYISIFRILTFGNNCPLNFHLDFKQAQFIKNLNINLSYLAVEFQKEIQLVFMDWHSLIMALTVFLNKKVKWMRQNVYIMYVNLTIITLSCCWVVKKTCLAVMIAKIIKSLKLIF